MTRAVWAIVFIVTGIGIGIETGIRICSTSPASQAKVQVMDYRKALIKQCERNLLRSKSCEIITTARIMEID